MPYIIDEETGLVLGEVAEENPGAMFWLGALAVLGLAGAGAWWFAAKVKARATILTELDKLGMTEVFLQGMTPNEPAWGAWTASVVAVSDGHPIGTVILDVDGSVSMILNEQVQAQMKQAQRQQQQAGEQWLASTGKWVPKW